VREGSRGRNGRSRFCGKKTHWRTGSGGRTWSPTLLLWGKKDPHQTWERVGRRLQQLIPKPEVVLLEDASHFAMLDQPDAFTDALLTWRRSRCPDPSAAADQGL
jgi:pimeloyl-ACP methyl ester carboxylesterase